MPNWKKVIISGSDAQLNSLNLTNGATGSFTGSFIGDGSQLTGITFLPGGSDSQIQYNNGGTTSGATNFVYDDVNQRVGIGTNIPTEKLTVEGSISASGAIYDNIGSPGTSGQMIQSTGTGFNWVDNIAEASQDLIIAGKNMTGTTIEKGTPLYFSGSNTSGNTVGGISCRCRRSNQNACRRCCC